MTYAGLKKWLESLSERELLHTVNVYIEPEDEYYPIHSIGKTLELICDVLDDEHPILISK